LGGSQAIKTTASTLHAHEAGILISSLGQTLQDAIGVSRTLRIKFLWIDSLCIIQDSPEDVTTEISKMIDYYENCFLCISAAPGSSSIEGFLKPRTISPYQCGPFELPYQRPDGRVGSVQLASYDEYHSSMDPANERGWIQQWWTQSQMARLQGKKRMGGVP